MTKVVISCNYLDGLIFKFYTLTLHEFHAYGMLRLVSIICYQGNMPTAF